MRATWAWMGAATCLLAVAPQIADGAAPPADDERPAAEQSADAGGSQDLTLITLSTPAAMPARAFAYRLTHRFALRLDEGSFRDLASSLFGLDGGAQIGMALHYGLTANTQLALQRTNDRTIALLARQEVRRPKGQAPSLAIVASVEGLDNFSQEFSPRVGLALAHTFGKRVTLHAEPAWVGHTRRDFEARDGDRSSVVLGLGGRLRLTGGTSLVGEWTPRLAGYKGRVGGSTDDHLSFGFAWDLGGHSFQLNVSNHLGTTPAQVARGQQSLTGWFLGFNLMRRFY